MHLGGNGSREATRVSRMGCWASGSDRPLSENSYRVTVPVTESAELRDSQRCRKVEGGGERVSEIQRGMTESMTYQDRQSCTYSGLRI